MQLVAAAVHFLTTERQRTVCSQHLEAVLQAQVAVAVTEVVARLALEEVLVVVASLLVMPLGAEVRAVKASVNKKMPPQA